MVPGSFVPDRKSLDWFGTALLALILSCPAPVFAGAVELIQQGDKAFATKDFQNAEKPYEQALELEPDNYRLIYSLAEVKSQLGKYDEAEALANRVLARPLAKGRNVRVYLEGESEPLEAELVDENVMAPQDHARRSRPRRRLRRRTALLRHARSRRSRRGLRSRSRFHARRL